MFFKSLDKKIKDLGFIKMEENKHGVTYQRYNRDYSYAQKVTILYKKSGNHILQSYDKDLTDSKGVGNTCVGLTYKELKLFTKKMKKLGLN